jgi:hypothetical protein
VAVSGRGSVPYLAWADLAALVVVVREAELQNRAKQSRAEQSRASTSGVGVAWALAWCCFLLPFVKRPWRVSVSRSPCLSPLLPSPQPLPSSPTDGLASVLVAKSTSETDHCVATGMPRPTVVQQSDFTRSPAPLLPAPCPVCSTTPNGREKSQNVRRRLLALLTYWGST